MNTFMWIILVLFMLTPFLMIIIYPKYIKPNIERETYWYNTYLSEEKIRTE